MLTPELQKQLKAPFSPSDHKERKLPGGGRWFFIPWQKIRARLDQVCPDWECSYSDPLIVGDLVIVRCRIKIAGVSREAPGNSAAFPEKNSVGDYKFGNPIERAIADAFKNAAEMFGVAAYLDDQDLVIRHMKSQQDGRAYKYAYDNYHLQNGNLKNG